MPRRLEPRAGNFAVLLQERSIFDNWQAETMIIMTELIRQAFGIPYSVAPLQHYTDTALFRHSTEMVQHLLAERSVGVKNDR